MSQFNIDKQYIISLDSLDLSLLSRFIDKPYDDERVLWSKSYMDGESTYCQVTVPNELQDEDCYVEPSETYMCHICNIDVPQIYFKQHTESRLHHIYKKLTEKVLDNVSKQINIYIDSVGSNEQSNQFYCEICCKVVSENYKKNHNKSKYHLKSTENQKLAYNFVEIYVGSKDDETVRNNDKESNNSNIKEKDDKRHIEYLLETDVDTDQSSESDTEIENITNNSQILGTNNFMCNTPELYNSDESSSDDAEGCDNVLSRKLDTSDQIADFQLYLKEMVAKYNLIYKVPIIEDNSIVIVTPNGFKEKITIKTFHSFKNISSFMYCQLCKTWSDKHSNHIRTEEHVRNIVQPVNDNFIREVILNNKWSHCLLCNIMVINGYKHAAFNHIKCNGADPYETMEVPINPDITPKTTYSDVCKKHITAKNLTNHNEYELNNSNPQINKSSLVVKVSSNKSTINAIQNNELYCEICKVKVINNNMEVHKKGKRHQNNCLTSNKISSGPNNLVENQDSHNNTSEFTIEEKLLEYHKQMAPSSTNELKCLVCDVKVPNLDRDIIEHVEGLKHNKFMNALLLITKIVKKNIKHFYCELCKYDIEDFIDHIIQDVNHKIKFQAVFKTELREYVHDDPLSNDPLTCEYRKVYEDMLKQNKIVRNDNLLSYCNVCSITLMRMNEIDHMLSEWHKSSL